MCVRVEMRSFKKSSLFLKGEGSLWINDICDKSILWIPANWTGGDFFSLTMSMHWLAATIGVFDVSEFDLANDTWESIAFLEEFFVSEFCFFVHLFWDDMCLFWNQVCEKIWFLQN